MTSPKDWSPGILDSTITEEWYMKQNQELELLRQGILTEVGDLKPDVESDGEEDDQDRSHQAVDREGIRVMLTKMIRSELHEGFILCEGNGEHVTTEYIPDIHDEYFKPTTTSCFPVRTRSHTKTDPATTSEPVEVNEDPSTPNLVIDTGYNNKAKQAIEGGPKFIAPSSTNYEKYAKYFPGANLESIKSTFRATTQLGTRGAVKGYNLRNRILAPNPMLTTPRRNEDVATDTLYSSMLATPSVLQTLRQSQRYQILTGLI